jgi:uncharacterized glyoxalase superfamily metalloenzyme YdcJ
MREFVESLPNISVKDPKQRAANERECERRIMALSPKDRETFERTLREMDRESQKRYDAMSFRQKWRGKR